MPVLMEGYEDRCGFLYVKVYDLPASESRTLETIMVTLAIRDTGVEVG